MIGLVHVYLLTGILLASCAYLGFVDGARPRRVASAMFWLLLALLFIAGDALPAEFVGVLVIALAVVAGSGRLRPGRYPGSTPEARQLRAVQLGHRLFVPALLISALTLLCVLLVSRLHLAGRPVLAPDHLTVTALGLACVVAFVVALRLTGERAVLALQGARGLLDTMSWAAVLPLMLAVLGTVFAKSGVGELVSELLTQWLPLGNRTVAVVAYALGMAIFTMIMGNAFAAFPVMTVGIAIPVLVRQHGADPAPLAAIGMLSGYCGTLLTPMAANFNIVPAALLELRNQHAVIRAQTWTALPLFVCNVCLLLLLT